MEGAEEEETVIVAKENQQKWKLHMDPLVEISWPHKRCLDLMEEIIFLVGKSVGILETTSGGFTTQIAGLDK